MVFFVKIWGLEVAGGRGLLMTSKIIRKARGFNYHFLA